MYVYTLLSFVFFCDTSNVCAEKESKRTQSWSRGSDGGDEIFLPLSFNIHEVLVYNPELICPIHLHIKC